jgi:phenylalanyl-tRNA synthetase alpha chain
MEEKLTTIKNSALPMILEAKTPDELEEIRVQVLGRSGTLTAVMKEIAKVPKEDKPRMGKVINEIKQIIDNAIQEKSSMFQVASSKLPRSGIDVSLPGNKPPLGHLHLITQAIDEITQIFSHIGFTRVRYPEVEWDWYAFEALNFPENHPARDDWETFFIKVEDPANGGNPKLGPMILTPHTSSGQVREMIKHVEHIRKTQNTQLSRKSDIQKFRQSDSSDTQSPALRELSIPNYLDIKMLNIAKCYRRQSDISHTAMFHQFEGLVVGKDIAITHLKGTLDYFVKSYFGPQRKARIRPYHFQFTEPSFEVDVSCGVCLGKGCKLCKAGWLEMGGAGMVHPNVLKAGGINPEQYTGFAFGWGVERVLMMKEGIEIDDLRLLYSNKLEFLEQF